MQALVPDPLQACDIIQQACHSRGSAKQLLQSAQAAAVVFLQQLLAYMFGMEQASDAHCGSHNDQHTALHTYLHELLQQLSKASSHNEVTDHVRRSKCKLGSFDMYHRPEMHP